MSRLPGFDAPEAAVATEERPSLAVERAAWAAGWRRVAGVDEAGRGALAGPVVAGAVVLGPEAEAALDGVRDSKLLGPSARAALEGRVREVARAWGVGAAAAWEIDALGIARAGELAMLRALCALDAPGVTRGSRGSGDLGAPPDRVLVDGFALRLWPKGRQEVHVKGDRYVLSIAAASILAKVHRDAWMLAEHARCPGYGYDGHKGYGAPAHLRAIALLGATSEHRLSWRPLTGSAPAPGDGRQPALPLAMPGPAT